MIVPMTIRAVLQLKHLVLPRLSNPIQGDPGGTQPPHQIQNKIIIRIRLKGQRPAILQVPSKFPRIPFHKFLDGCRLFLRPNLFILFLVRGCFEALPGKGTAEKVEEDMPDRFEVIPATLFPSQMSVDGHVPGCTGQALAFPIRDMDARLWVPEILCHPKVDQEEAIGFTLRTDEKVVRFDVSVDEASFMNRSNQ